MVIYEVNLSIQRSIAQDYQLWLKKHIAEMLKIKGFKKACVFRRNPKYENSTNDENILLTVHYRIDHRENLERYFFNEAKVMRQEARDLFGNKFSATRRVLEDINDDG